jgi:SAM-dependent methyltransferase
MPILHYPQWTPGDLHLQERPRHFLETLGQSRFDRFVLPYSGEAFWKGTGFEQMAAACARQLDILQPDGESRTYRGEDIHRIIYNKSYLASLLAHTTVQGKRVLDVGCSDGLACDLLLHERPESITGVDVMKTVGCVYHDPRISYHTRDAAHLDFADASFDVCYSIATLEHCEDPYRVLQEIRRVTKPGGVAYVQAGPLYYSPFGHHMFGYFDDFPWIHLRRDFNGILDYCREKGIADRIRQTLHRAPEEYVADMLNVRHINGLAFHEYRVTEFLESNDIEVLSFSRSTEGEKLITRELAEEMDTVPVEDLLSHGFELAFRRK